MKFGNITCHGWQPGPLLTSELKLSADHDLWIDWKTRMLLDMPKGWQPAFEPPILASIEELNTAINAHYKYIPDTDGDHWKTPQEFDLAGGGDCEDFALFKLWWLFGQFLRDTRLVALRNRDDGSGHMVCMSMLDREWLVLDNATDKTEPQEDWAAVYDVVYSLDWYDVWTHRKEPHELPAV